MFYDKQQNPYVNNARASSRNTTTMVGHDPLVTLQQWVARELHSEETNDNDVICAMRWLCGLAHWVESNIIE